MRTDELAKLLRANPDLSVDIDMTAPTDHDMRQAAYKLTEHAMQARVFEICALRALTNRDWEMVVAIPNGQYRTGQRMEPGIKRGFPDLIVPIPRHSRNGLALELKVHPNKPSDEQLWWHRRLRLYNWAVDVIFDDPLEVIDHIAWYLEK